MSFEDFKKEVADRIKDFLPEKYANADIRIESVVKNNDQKLSGIVIRQEESNIAPNIYLESFYKEHENGKSMDSVLESIAKTREKYDVDHNFDVSKIADLDIAKDRITCRLVNAKQNAEYLSDKPHKVIDDLAVTYHVAIGSEGGSHMSAPITDRLMESYGIDTEQLHKIAVENMDSLTPASFKGMTETMVDMMMPDMIRSGMTEDEAKDAIAALIPNMGDEKMYVLTNDDKLNGAAMLLNDKVMDEVSEKLGGDYYILPSSVHEVLIVPDRPEYDLKTLENMVRDVNATQVDPEDRLSDHVYSYDAKEHELFRADKAEERAANKEKAATKVADKPEKKPVRKSLKERLAEKKAQVVKNEAGREHRQMKKDRGPVMM